MVVVTSEVTGGQSRLYQLLLALLPPVAPRALDSLVAHAPNFQWPAGGLAYQIEQLTDKIWPAGYMFDMPGLKNRGQIL